MLLLSTLDWALIETWKDAGIPLEAVLRGIDAAFDRYDRRANKTRKVNGLAFCSQEVLAAAEEMKEAAVGTQRNKKGDAESGLTAPELRNYLVKNAELLRAAKLDGQTESVARECADSLLSLGEAVQSGSGRLPLEDIERRLTVLEEKLNASLFASAPEKELISIRADADRQLAPYRGKMNAAQIDQLHRQFLHKRLIERYSLPRLSLFYM